MTEHYLKQLNTRDKLLLSQIIEQYGLKDMALLHQTFTRHPAFLLSHNELVGDPLGLSLEQFQGLVDELFATFPDATVVQVCELLYAQRTAELQGEIAHNQNVFHVAKRSLEEAN